MAPEWRVLLCLVFLDCIVVVKMAKKKLYLPVTAWSPLTFQAATHSTDVVIVLAWGYSLRVYSGFAVSLRKTGFVGDVKILGVEGAPRPDDEEAVRSWSSRWRIEFVTVRKMSLPTLERFGLFATICRDGGYSRCLVGDMRDVYFQTDPFVRLSHTYPGNTMPDLVLPLEVMPLGTCWNDGYPTCMGKRLMAGCFGSSVWQKHADKRLAEQPTICEHSLTPQHPFEPRPLSSGSRTPPPL